MGYKIFALHFFLLIIGINSFAQTSGKKKEDGDLPKNIIKTNPVPIINGPIPGTSEYRLVYERAISGHHAGQVGFSLLTKGPFTNVIEKLINKGVEEIANQDSVEIGDININGFRVQAAYKYYFKDAPKGFYLSPQFSYARAEYHLSKIPEGYISAHYINGVALVGYQVIAGHFALDLFTGFGGKANTLKAHAFKYKINFPISSPFKFVAGFNIGVAF